MSKFANLDDVDLVRTLAMDGLPEAIVVELKAELASRQESNVADTDETEKAHAEAAESVEWKPALEKFFRGVKRLEMLQAEGMVCELGYQFVTYLQQGGDPYENHYSAWELWRKSAGVKPGDQAPKAFKNAIVHSAALIQAFDGDKPVEPARIKLGDREAIQEWAANWKSERDEFLKGLKAQKEKERAAKDTEQRDAESVELEA